MLRQIIAIVVVGAVAMTAYLAASPKLPDIERSSKSRIANPQVPPSDLSSLADAHRDFSLKLYQQVRGANGNLLFSPYSIAAALSMTMAGAKGETAKQMMAAMSLTLPDARVNAAMNAMGNRLARAMQGDDRQKDEQGKLSIANGIWLQSGEKILPAYLDCLGENYGAGVGMLDFARQPEAASKTINAWVSHETEGRIPDLVSPDVIQRAVLVLTNAIYFKGFWSVPFEKGATTDADFHLLDGKTIKAPTMHQRETLPYAKIDDLEIVELPYRGGSLAMRILVPAAGKFAAVESSLDAARLKAAAAALAERPIALGLPKFTFTASLALNETLAALGMPIAFSGKADFSGINGERDLVISDVIHKAFVAVDEKGTEAAAATAVAMARTSMMPQLTTLIIDRPFIFSIVERETGEILFLGRVLDPTAK